MSFRVVVLTLGLLLAAAPGAAGAAVVVNAPTGPVSGVSVGAMDEWRGIPYAKPPIGALRWKAPADMEPWTVARVTQKFGNACASLKAVFTAAGIASLSLFKSLLLAGSSHCAPRPKAAARISGGYGNVSFACACSNWRFRPTAVVR